MTYTYRQGGAFLNSLRVGVSVSAVPDADLVERGLSHDHFDFVFLELARHQLATGALLAYGGDLRSGGFTERLELLLREILGTSF